MKAKDAVDNLRKLADVLEKHGDADLEMAHATIWTDSKDSFMSLAADFPRPAQKRVEEGKYGNLILRHGELSTGGVVDIRIGRDKLCRIVEPAREAVYEYDPALSADYEDEMGAE